MLLLTRGGFGISVNFPSLPEAPLARGAVERSETERFNPDAGERSETERFNP